MNLLISFFTYPPLVSVGMTVLHLLPFWFPVLMVVVFFQTWVKYVRTKYIGELKTVLMEIKLPREVNKSPAAMELLLSGLYEPVVGTYSEVFFQGRVRDWFSLEIVSIDGDVRFYIWALERWKNTIESRVYAQYPTAEVFEAKDYAMDMHYDPSKYSVFGVQMGLTKPDPYPIKTYIDYGLDKDPKEEYKIDPLTPLIEFFGSIKQGEQMWMQIMIQSHRKENFEDIRIIPKPDWKSAAKAEIKKIIESAHIKPEKDKPASLMSLTEAQKKAIDAIERSIGKIAYDTMIRVLYIGTKEAYDSAKNYGLMGSFRHFGSHELNGLRPIWFPGYAYPWMDFGGKKAAVNKRELVDAYKRRSFFNLPYKNFRGKKAFVLTVEELATLFHFPGVVASTPGLTRVPSKKGEPPGNLPV